LAKNEEKARLLADAITALRKMGETDLEKTAAFIKKLENVKSANTEEGADEK
jgi:hypothetical protein